MGQQPPLARQKPTTRPTQPSMSFADTEKAVRACVEAQGDATSIAAALSAVTAHEQLAAAEHGRLSAVYARAERRLRGSRGTRDRLLKLQNQIALALRDANKDIASAENEHRHALQARSHCAAKKRCMYSHRQCLENLAQRVARPHTSPYQGNK